MLSKITESVICDNIDNDLSNVLQKNQWGYRKGVSTESLLLYLTETWKINIDHKMQLELSSQIFDLNDFAESLSNGEMYLDADDTTAFATGNSVDQLIQLLNVLPKEIIQWCTVNRLTIH